MSTVNKDKLTLTIASTILKEKGEISVEDIRSLPYLDDNFDISVIVRSLLEMFDAEIVSQKISSSPFLRWEQIIRLREKPVGTETKLMSNYA